MSRYVTTHFVGSARISKLLLHGRWLLVLSLEAYKRRSTRVRRLFIYSSTN